MATTPIIYKGWCGDPKNGGEFYYFEWPEEAPSFLTDFPLSDDPHPYPDEVGRFALSMVDKHNYEIRTARAWNCVSCGIPATEIYHLWSNYLKPGAKPLPEYQPTLLDHCAPICRSGGECDQKTQQMMVKALDLELGKMVCETCGIMSGVKRCSGCKTLG